MSGAVNSGGLFGGLFDAGRADLSDRAWLRAMLEAEGALARALERAGLAPAGAGRAVTEAARADHFDIAELGRAATAAGNPVPPLVRALTARVPDWAEQTVHRGATSQDIIDTAMMLLARDATGVIAGDLAGGAEDAARLAAEHAHTIMIGRTLLQQAVPITFGLVSAGWLTALDDARQRLAEVRGNRLGVQLGGAAGTLAALGDAGPVVVRLFAEELGLNSPPLPWHTERLRILELAAALAGVGAATGKIARDVTLLAQSEVGEVSEGRAEGDAAAAGVRPGGSSAMPHKRNPVAAVLILGCAKRLPGLLATLASATEQEHQRAAGAWHAEWVPLTDLLRLSGAAAAWTRRMLSGLTVHPARMRANLDAARGLPLAGNVATLLAPVLGPVAAHDLIAKASRAAAESGTDLAAALSADENVTAALDLARIDRERVDAALDPGGYLGGTRQFIEAALARHRAAG